MKLISSPIFQPPQQQTLSSEFYDHVSEIIKIFRKQMNVLLKLTSSLIECSDAIQQINQKKEEGLQMVHSYQQFIIDDNLYIVIQRFIGRIKEIIQLTPNLHQGMLIFITNCLKKLEIYLHKNINSITVFHVFNDILNIIPSYFQNKPFSPQKSKKNIKESSPLKPSKVSNTLEVILESYRKSFSLLSTLDIDQSEYRSVFFSARDDKYKGTAFLQNEMRYRNRFIKEQMNRFDRGYVTYMQRKKREKTHGKRKHISRMKRIVSMDEQTSIVKIVTSKSRNNQNSQNPALGLHSLKQISSNKSSQTPQLRTITQISQKNTCLLQTAFNFQKSRQQRAKSYLNGPQQKDKSGSGKKSYGKVRQDEFQDFVTEIKTKGQFRMTKVLFGKDGKMQLSPFKNQQKNQKITTFNGLKNKIIFRKAQQNIRKKFNRLATQPPSTKKQSSQQKHSASKQIKNHYSTQQSESKAFAYETQNNKKVQKTTFKQKQVKLMGIKGISNRLKSSSFDDTDRFWTNNISGFTRVQETALN